MHAPETLTSLTVLILTALIFGSIMRLLRLPVIAGYLLAGVLAGPGGLALLPDSHQVRDLAELGVVLLLFSIGLEMSPSRLWSLRREALLGGGLQVGITAAASAGLSLAFGVPLALSVTVGFALSLSSTAVVLRLLGEAGETDTPHGRLSLAFLLLQDLAVVPMALIIPILGHGGSAGAGALLLTIGKAVLVVVAVLLVARKAVPLMLDHVAAQRSRESFLLAVGSVVLFTAWITTYAGLSPALGAFLAGLVVSETEHKHVALSETVPFRDLFLAVFFVSIGLLMDLGAFVASPFLAVGLAVAVYAGKAIIAGGVVRLLGYQHGPALRTGVRLGQVGEFSFMLLLVGAAAGVITEGAMQTLVTTAALTLFATPFVIRAGDAASRRLPRFDPDTAVLSPSERRGLPHVALIGFGPSGQTLARILRELHVPYKIAEMNPATVRKHSAAGEPIVRGDASRPEVMEELDIHHAMAAVVTINDPVALRPVIQHLRREAPEVHLIVRTRYIAERDELLELGADTVVPAEAETALRITSLLLDHLGISHDVAERHLEQLRGDDYALHAAALPFNGETALPKGIQVRAITLEEGDAAVGRSLSDLDLRGAVGANAVVIVRGSEPLLDPARARLMPGDRLVLSGTSKSLHEAMRLLRDPSKGSV